MTSAASIAPHATAAGAGSRCAIEWQAYAQGEYVGHARLAHVPSIAFASTINST